MSIVDETVQVAKIFLTIEGNGINTEEIIKIFKTV
tara:strand:+ start:652 stop:756 length:105 start_codon:yes stop_codon:yes gene_type:complete